MGNPASRTWAATMDRWNARGWVAQRARIIQRQKFQANSNKRMSKCWRVRSFGEAHPLAPVEDGSTELCGSRFSTYGHYIEHAQVITLVSRGFPAG
jgi:hypothetical protein